MSGPWNKSGSGSTGTSGWGVKASSGSTGKSTAWGTKDASLQTTNKSTFSGGFGSTSSAQVKQTSGTQWTNTPVSQQVQALELVNSIDIPFAPSAYKDETNPNQHVTYQIQNILYFGIFNFLNMETLRYNDYVKKGGIKPHDWDQQQKQQAAGTTTTTTTGYSFGQGKTGFGTGMTSQNPPLPTSPWLHTTPDKFDVTKVPEDETAGNKPYGDIEETKLVVTKASANSVSDLKRLRKFTPKGIVKNKTIHEIAIQNGTNLEETPAMYNFQFKESSQSGNSNVHTTSTAAVSSTISSNKTRTEVCDSPHQIKIGGGKSTFVYSTKLGETNDALVNLTVLRISDDFDPFTIDFEDGKYVYRGDEYLNEDIVITSTKELPPDFNALKLGKMKLKDIKID